MHAMTAFCRILLLLSGKESFNFVDELKLVRNCLISYFHGTVSCMLKPQGGRSVILREQVQTNSIYFALQHLILSHHFKSEPGSGVQAEQRWEMYSDLVLK